MRQKVLVRALSVMVFAAIVSMLPGAAPVAAASEVDANRIVLPVGGHVVLAAAQVNPNAIWHNNVWGRASHAGSAV
jgi:hypothetical protein